MEIKEKVYAYLLAYGKENKYRIATALKTDVEKVTKALIDLEEEGVIKMRSGSAVLVRGKKPSKAKKKEKPNEEEPAEEKPKKEPKEEKEEEKEEEKPEAEESKEKEEKKELEEKPEEQPETEISSKSKRKARKKKKREEFIAKEEEPTEEASEKSEVAEEPTEKEAEEQKEKPEEEERVEGTVKFFNQNKGFGFITGDDGEEYYVHKSALKEGVTIEANNRVSFKIVQGDKGPKAEEVEWISQA